MKKFILGLTGGIAGGKSVVSDIYSASGATVIDADVISRQVMIDEKIITQIEKTFPGSVKNGKIDRNELKKQAFSMPDNTRKLNSITHPAILAECKNRLDSANGFVVFVVPLMFETGANKFCDAVLTISCPEKIRIERLVSRDNIDIELAKKIIMRQNTDSDREKQADYVIVNDSTPEELGKKALRLMGEIIKNQ